MRGCILYDPKSIMTEIRLVVVRGWGKRKRRRLTTKKHLLGRRPFGDDENVLYLDCADGYMTACVKIHVTVLLKRISFIAGKKCLNKLD